MKLLSIAAALLLLGESPSSSAPAMEAISALTPTVHEPTLNGVRLWYRVAGQRRGTPVIYLAGGPGGNHYEFATFAGPVLERSLRMVYFDGRGTGRSERPVGGDYRIATLIDDIEALRRHLGAPKIALMAHSFAGILALEYGAKYPQHTAALVLVGGVWDMPASCQERIDNYRLIAPAAYQSIMAAGAPPRDKVCEATFFKPREEFERANDQSMFPIPSSREKQAEAAQRSGLRNTGELSKAVFRGGLLTYRFDKPDRVTSPVLLIAGAKDFAAGINTQRKLAQLLPNASIVEYPNYGHWMFIDDPERFGRDVSRFLRGR